MQVHGFKMYYFSILGVIVLILEFKMFDIRPLKIQNGQIKANCIHMYGEIHQNIKANKEREKSLETHGSESF